MAFRGLTARGWNFRVRSGLLGNRRDSLRRFCRPTHCVRRKIQPQDFIFAQDVILDPDTSKVLAVVRNGGIWRDGTKIAVLVGAHIYDLNGNLLGTLTRAMDRCRFRTRTY